MTAAARPLIASDRRRSLVGRRRRRVHLRLLVRAAERRRPTCGCTTEAIYIGIAAIGLNILTGYNGQVSIGHGAFFGLGAYTTAILVTEHGWNFVPTIPVVDGAVLRRRRARSASRRCG